jgi:enoyl-[acyl-carrier protein] reductase III
MKYALVIGGSQGLGLATVEKLLVEGVPVIAIHRDFKKDLPGVQQAFREFEAQTTPFHAIHMDAIRKTDHIVGSIKDQIGLLPQGPTEMIPRPPGPPCITCSQGHND